MSLEGRVAIVTGAGGQGMGRSIALTLGREGATVVVNYRTSQDSASETAAAIERLGGRARLIVADVSVAEDVHAMCEQAAREFGRVDIVVNSAGAPWKPQDVTEITPDHLRTVLAREVESTYSLLRETLPGMRERRWGRFISIGGHMADDWRFGPPDAPLDYPLGKAARHWVTRTLAPRELPHGITINAIAPGPTERFTLQEAEEAARARTVAGDRNTPQNIAEAVAFLCSDAASRITGAVIPLPGHRPV
jgi:3-oxoacyl-[acyl-carrier protein] reductase